jgi:hypothetical protein
LPDSVAIRKRLAKEGKLACPKTLNYRLDSKKHTVSAMAYYQHDNTVKCEGGQKKICAAYKRYGLTDNEAFKKHCK